MNSRPLLAGSDKMGIFLESKSIEKLLQDSDPNTRRLVPYRDTKLFNFLRSAHPTKEQELNRIVQAELKTDNSGPVPYIDSGDRRTGFFYKMQDVESVAKEVFGVEKVGPSEIDRVLVVFLHAELNSDGRSLLVTGDDVLLQHKLWFEAHFPGGQLNIGTVQESLESMDLFAKQRREYHVASIGTYNKGYWYLLYFRSMVPYHSFATPTLESLGSRFQYALMSVDEIGMQYYSESNNDNMQDTMYHFNYFVSLVSGIFDSLAIEAKKKLKLKFDRDDIPSKTSLSNDTGRDFLRALKEKDPALRKHVNDHVDFIKLIYELRELVLHREGLGEVKFVYRDDDQKWEANFIRPSRTVLDLIKRCGDKKPAFEVLTDWGVFTAAWLGYTSPYRFSQSATSTLAIFCNDYLRLLGYDDFTGRKGNEKLLEELDTFNKSRLAN